MRLLALLIDGYSLVILVAVILSWVQLPEDNPLVRITRQLTEPVLGPVRRMLPEMGGLDFSAMVVLSALRFLKRALFG
jgi:YggT family protein